VPRVLSEFALRDRASPKFSFPQNETTFLALMDDIRIELHGLQELQSKLRSVGPELTQRIIRSGLQAAADVFASALRESAPVRTTPGERPPGELRDSVVTDVVVAPGGAEGTARVGFQHLGHLAHWLEFGHQMVGHKPENKQLSGPNTQGGMVKPHPFVRAAADSAKRAAAQAFVEAVQQELKGIRKL
jgi:HK97 gp10 family phage protein